MEEIQVVYLVQMGTILFTVAKITVHILLQKGEHKHKVVKLDSEQIAFLTMAVLGWVEIVTLKIMVAVEVEDIMAVVVVVIILVSLDLVQVVLPSFLGIPVAMQSLHLLHHQTSFIQVSLITIVAMYSQIQL